MTSSNGNIFRVTGPLCGEFTGHRWIPPQRPVTWSFDVFFDLRLNKRLSKQSQCWWFETQSCPLWRHCNAITAPEDGFTLFAHAGLIITHTRRIVIMALVISALGWSTRLSYQQTISSTTYCLREGPRWLLDGVHSVPGRWAVVCSTSLMASLIRAVGGLSKRFYQGLWLAVLSADVIDQSINRRGVA